MNTGFVPVAAKLLGYVVEHSMLPRAGVKNEYSYSYISTWILIFLNIYCSQRQTRLLTMSVMILESPLWHSRPVITDILQSWQQFYRGADMSLARLWQKQAWKHSRDTCDFNVETRVVINFFFPARQGAKGNSRLTETLACFLLGQANDLSAPLYIGSYYRVG
jgi:hypothetical protein